MCIGFNCNIIGWNKSYYLVCVRVRSVLSDSVMAWTVARQASLSTVLIFPRQECWSRLPFPSPGDHPSPGIEHMSLASPSLAGGLFTTEPPGKPLRRLHLFWCCFSFLKHLWNSCTGNRVCVFGGGLLIFLKIVFSSSRSSAFILDQLYLRNFWKGSIESQVRISKWKLLQAGRDSELALEIGWLTPWFFRG